MYTVTVHSSIISYDSKSVEATLNVHRQEDWIINLWLIHTVKHDHIFGKKFLMRKLSVSRYRKILKLYIKRKKSDVDQHEQYATLCKERLILNAYWHVKLRLITVEENG